jgi:hypothetical protein
MHKGIAFHLVAIIKLMKLFSRKRKARFRGLMKSSKLIGQKLLRNKSRVAGSTRGLLGGKNQSRGLGCQVWLAPRLSTNTNNSTNAFNRRMDASASPVRKGPIIRGLSDKVLKRAVL